MSEEQAPYKVSYIALSPDELKVGDIVEVVDGHDDLYLQKGYVVSISDDGDIEVQFGNNKKYIYDIESIRKCSCTTHVEEKDNPLDKQVGGSHYKDMAIQPVEFCMKNNLDFCTSSAIKYLCRRKKKNGKEDLLKAKHFIDLLIQLEYPE